MPFISSAESLRARLHVSNVSRTHLVSVLVLVVSALLLVGFNVFACMDTHQISVSVEHDDQSADAEKNITDVRSNSSSTDTSESVSEPSQQDLLVAYISGAVVSPGVYELEKGSRIQDLIQAAGGVTDGALQESVNLAQPISDGSHIHIPHEEDAGSSAYENDISSDEIIATQQPSSSRQSQGTININTADAKTLEQLPGIGPSTAQKIISDRQKNGPFRTKEDLKRVSGIGDKKYEALADVIGV